MLKSYAQQIVENDHGGRELKEILVEKFEARRGQPFLVTRVTGDLKKVSSVTVRAWCEKFDINIQDYQ